MRIFPYQDGDQLIELVEKRELDDLLSLLESEKSTRNHLIKRGSELERELNAAKALIESLEDALIEIEACCYEDDSSNLAADASWHLARKALKKLKEHNK